MISSMFKKPYIHVLFGLCLFPYAIGADNVGCGAGSECYNKVAIRHDDSTTWKEFCERDKLHARIQEICKNLAGSESDRLLLQASLSGNLEDVKLALSQGANINTASMYSSIWGSGQTPLMNAARKGHQYVVRYLLEMGADPDRMNGIGENAFIAAAGTENNIAVFDLLLPRTDNPAQPRIIGGNVADYACLERNVKNMNYLNAKGIKPYLLKLGIAACASGGTYHKKVETQPNRITTWGMYCLHSSDLLERFRTMCDNLQANEYDKMLLQAASNGSLKGVRAALSQGANINAVSIDNTIWTSGYTPLINASMNGHSEIVRILIKGGANPNQLTGYSSNAFIEAASRESNTEILELLFPLTEDPQLQRLGMGNAADMACEKNNKINLQFLLSKGIKPAMCGYKGKE